MPYEVPDGLFHFKWKEQEYSLDLCEYELQNIKWQDPPIDAQAYWYLDQFRGWVKSLVGIDLPRGAALALYHACRTEALNTKKKQAEELVSIAKSLSSTESTPEG